MALSLASAGGRGREPSVGPPLPLRRILAALGAVALLVGCNEPVRTVAPPARKPPVSLRSKSQRPDLEGLVLVVRGGTFTNGRLELLVAMENRGQKRVRASGLSGRDLRLTGADGTDDAPLEAAPNLDPWTTHEGLAPKTYNDGLVVFLIPGASGRHQLRLDGFAPLELDLARLPAPAPSTLVQVTGRRPDVEARGQLEHLLVEQSVALRSRDMDRYLATLTPELRQRETGLARQLDDAEVSGVSLHLLDEPLAQRHGSFDAGVELTYWLEDLPDDNPFVHSLIYRIREVDGEWLVHSITAPLGERMPFWSEPGVQRQATSHFVAFSRLGSEQQLFEVIQEAELAYARLQGLRLPLADRYALHVLPGPEFARKLGGSVVDAALARYTLEEGAIRIDNQALYVTGALFAEGSRRLFDERVRQETMAHEIVHLALMPRTRPTTPVWLVEGAAVYFSGDLGPSTARRLLGRLESLSLPGLSGAASLQEHRFGSPVDQYDYAGLAVAFLVRSRGMDAFSDLYEAFSLLPPDRAMAARLEDEGLTRGFLPMRDEELRRRQSDEVLQEVLGTSLEDLDAELEAWIREQATLG